MFYQKSLARIPFFVFKELEEIPGLIHAFTSRQTDTVMIDAEGSGEVAPEKQLLLQTMGLKLNQLVFLHQVHSDRVVTLNSSPANDSGPTEVGPADGVITAHPTQFPVIRTADCLPILAILPEQRQVCALHAGWRGTRDRITVQGVGKFLKMSEASPDQLVAAIGPCIRKCCYKVGPEIWDQYKEAGHDVERFFMGGHLDLVRANVAQLQELGVSQILDSEVCTCCRNDLFYSHRRERQAGRMWALAGFR
ncbi:peptidoglycan editing factor PgeF [Acidobacteria bacterium AH-259-O06]|nr:peptidoglycan editing factor PgeF [Acidobacteria bacterium AH-259-O06]